MAKRISKILVDLIMFVFFLLLMEEHLIPDGTHEWIGLSLFIVTIIHIILNYKWYKTLFKGKYSIVRIIQTVVNAFLMLSMICCLISSFMISGTVFKWIRFGGTEVGRKLHMISTSWAFVLMNIHLGLHWAQFIAMCRKIKLSVMLREIFTWILRGIVLLISIYGIVVFIQRSFYEELFLLTMFKNFDYEKSALIYLFETCSMAILLISLSYYIKKMCLKIKKIHKEKYNEKDL